MKYILAALLVVMTVLFLKTKLDLYVASMWMVENKLEPPDDTDAKRLATKITQHWFHKG